MAGRQGRQVWDATLFLLIAPLPLLLLLLSIIACASNKLVTHCICAMAVDLCRDVPCNPQTSSSSHSKLTSSGKVRQNSAIFTGGWLIPPASLPSNGEACSLGQTVGRWWCMPGGWAGFPGEALCVWLPLSHHHLGGSSWCVPGILLPCQFLV